MGRPERHDVDYFPFFAKRGKTLNILQSKYGLEGIGFFTNLMRFLALTPDHYYCIKEDDDRLNLFAEIGIQEEEKGIEIIELMVKTEKLDKNLWKNHKVIACEAFLQSLQEAYKNRKNKIITIDEIRAIFAPPVSYPEKPQGDVVSYSKNPAVCGLSVKFSDNNPQSKVKKSKVKKSKINSIGSEEPTEPKRSILSTPDYSRSTTPLDYNPSTAPPIPKPDKPKKLPLREREPMNDFERVEKTYITNWSALYSQGKVKTPDPIVNWNQIRKLLKNLFAKLKTEQIIQAINNGMKDDFIMQGGYSLGVMLSASVLNRLINAAQAESPVSKHQREKLSLE